MYNHLNFYLNLNWEHFANDEENYFLKINNIISLAYQHKINVYYNPSQIEDFKKNCSDWDDNFAVSKANKLDTILEDALPSKEEYFYFEVLFSETNTALSSISDSSISIIAHNENVSLLAFSESAYQKCLLRVKSNNNFDCVKINFVPSKEAILHWIWDNSDKRNFHLSLKHGEDGIGNWTGESALLCNKIQAQEYLNLAIGDFRKKKRLFYFDENNDKFLEFYYEGDNPQKQWHGFHIEQNDWNKRVPNSVLKYFNKKIQ